MRILRDSLLFLCLAAQLGAAQTTPPAAAPSTALPVIVQTQAAKASEYNLLGKTPDRKLILQPKGTTSGELTLPANQIVEMNFIYPPKYRDAQQALYLGELEKAIPILNPIVTPRLAYLDLPCVKNLIPVVLTFADTYRRVNKFNEAIALYEKVRMLPKSVSTIRATILISYCLAEQNKTDQAAKMLANNEPLKRDHELYYLERFARARIKLAEKDFRGSLDDIGQVTSALRIEHELYPESLWLTAQSYEALAQFEASQPSPVLTAADTVAVTARTVDYKKVAGSIYLEITKNYPGSYWAKKSLPKAPAAPVATTNSADTVEIDTQK
jgi:hypothetical protein